MVGDDNIEAVFLIRNRLGLDHLEGALQIGVEQALLRFLRQPRRSVGQGYASAMRFPTQVLGPQQSRAAPEFKYTPVLWDVEMVEDPMKPGIFFGAEASVQIDPSA